MAEKYARLLALRRAVGVGGRPDAAARAELRAVARQWPGALRELDSLATDELERRAAACRAADVADFANFAGAADPADPADPAEWIGWMARYHELMRAALAIRRGEPTDAVDAAFVAAVARPQHGRLNVVVFAQLAVEVRRPAAELWNRLFPRRGSVPRGYRD
jgi:hypothetical protein